MCLRKKLGLCFSMSFLIYTDEYPPSLKRRKVRLRWSEARRILEASIKVHFVWNLIDSSQSKIYVKKAYNNVLKWQKRHSRRDKCRLKKTKASNKLDKSPEFKDDELQCGNNRSYRKWILSYLQRSGTRMRVEDSETWAQRFLHHNLLVDDICRLLVWAFWADYGIDCSGVL